MSKSKDFKDLREEFGGLCEDIERAAKLAESMDLPSVSSILFALMAALKNKNMDALMRLVGVVGEWSEQELERRCIEDERRGKCP